MLSHAKVISLSCTVILLYDTMATLGRRSVSGGAWSSTAVITDGGCATSATFIALTSSERCQAQTIFPVYLPRACSARYRPTGEQKKTAVYAQKGDNTHYHIVWMSVWCWVISPFWATVCKTVRPVLLDRCLPVLLVCNVGVGLLWQNG